MSNKHHAAWPIDRPPMRPEVVEDLASATSMIRLLGLRWHSQEHLNPFAYWTTAELQLKVDRERGVWR